MCPKQTSPIPLVIFYNVDTWQPSKEEVLQDLSSILGTRH